MASGRLLLPLAEPTLTNLGLPASGATLLVNIAGGSTPASLFADAALSTPIANPQTSNSAGRFYIQSTEIWADSSQGYDCVLTLTDGEVFTYSNIYLLGAATNVSGFAPINSPNFTGVPTAPTPALNDNSQKLATTGYVQGQNYAPLNSPALTGVPTAPTAAANTNTTQLATTAFVTAAVGAVPLFRFGTTSSHSQNDGAQVTSFSTPFPGGCDSVQLTLINAGAATTLSITGQEVSKSASSFSWIAKSFFASGNGTAVTFDYCAIGH